MGVLVIFKIEMSDVDLEVIGSGLDELKYKVAAPVAARIQAQINAQLNPPPAPEPVTPKRRKTKGL